MEKRISFQQFQQAKSVAKSITPFVIKKNKIQAEIDGLNDEFMRKGEEKLAKLKEALKQEMAKKRESLEKEKQELEDNIALYESGIFHTFGVHVTNIVKRVVEPTGKTDKEGHPIKKTDYLPTDIVSYDEQTKQYVITLPDEEEPIVPPTTEDGPGSDFDIDVENSVENTESETFL